MSVKASLQKIRIGTRGSPLALVQAGMVRDELAKIDSSINVEIRVIKTSGDWRPEQGEIRLEESLGGKGLFAKELEAALLAGEIDVAVHSMKDMEVDLPEGLEIPFMLPREDVRDVFLSNIGQNINDLPVGSIVGTVSARRAAFLLSRRPDLRIVPLRGNVQTRIDKMKAGQVDATLLAYAGLSRLNLIAEVVSVMPVAEILPAVGQGAIGLEIRSEDKDRLSIFSQLNCFKTETCISIERMFLKGLGGSCHTPVGVYAVVEGAEVWLRVILLAPDGSEQVRGELRLPYKNMQALSMAAEQLGREIRAKAPKGSLS